MAIQVIINQKGPLPITVTFNAPGDSRMYLEINGSVWSQQANRMIGIGVKVDNNAAGAAQIFSNGPATHRAGVPAFIAINLSQCKHTLSLSSNSYANTCDYHDIVPS